MAAASPVPVLEMSQGGDLRVIAYLRELRQEIQNLQEGLEKLKTASGLTTEDAKSVLISACQESKARFERNRESIDTLQHSIRRVFQGDEALHARYGDAVAEIGNKWDAIVAHWSSGSDPAVAARIKEVDDEMDRIVYLCALLTVPERVNRNLETMRVGQKLDFKQAFHEEIPEEAHAQKLLDFLAIHPKLVHGLVDPQAGLVYRSSRRPWRAKLK
ncbi:MAG: hypothetical protein FJW20_12490 [Acidimicrobiia bacterium]|nr:hypothetical protein [Acidimicrobiia bacterium]